MKSTGVILKVDELVSRINNHREYSKDLKNRLVNELNIEAHKHSNSIELEVDVDFKKLKDKPATEKKTLRALERTWEYLDEEGIRRVSLACLGNILEPEKNKIPNFRHDLIQFGPFIPPMDYHSIVTSVDNLLFHLERNDIHPIDKAIHGHIEIVKIHPYLDGNGRIARLLQNYILVKNNYPPATIQSSERALYIKLMQGTLEDRFAKKSDIHKVSANEDLFHEFIISKILQAAERIEDNLKKHRLYEIELQTPNKSIGFSIAKILRNYSSQGSEGIKVNLVHSDGHIKLDVEGDISQASLTAALQKHAGNYNLRYSVKIKH